MCIRDSCVRVGAVVRFKGEKVDFNAVVSVVHCPLCLSGIILRGSLGNNIRPPAKLKLACICSELRTAFSAQKFVYRRIVVLALYLPQGNINS